MTSKAMRDLKRLYEGSPEAKTLISDLLQKLHEDGYAKSADIEMNEELHEDDYDPDRPGTSREEEHEVLIGLAQKIIKGRQRREAEKARKQKESDEHYKELKERGTFKEEPVLSCNFCGRHLEEVKKLIAGPKVRICDKCVTLCNDIIEKEMGNPKEEKVCEKCGNKENVRTFCQLCRV